MLKDGMTVDNTPMVYLQLSIKALCFEVYLQTLLKSQRTTSTGPRIIYLISGHERLLLFIILIWIDAIPVFGAIFALRGANRHTDTVLQFT